MTRKERWHRIEGGYSRGYRRDGLLRSLCWGNPSGWEAMAALIHTVRELDQEKLTAPAESTPPWVREWEAL